MWGLGIHEASDTSKIESNSFVTDCQEVKSTKECLELLTKNKENNTFIYSWNRAENFKNFGFILENSREHPQRAILETCDLRFDI